MGIYVFYLFVSGVPLIARIIVVAAVAEQKNTSFDLQTALVAEQPFWFAAVLSWTTLLRLLERVKRPEQDFAVPWLYNAIRTLLFVTGVTAIVGGVLVAYLLHSGSTLPKDLVFTGVKWVVPAAILLGLAQIGIRKQQEG